MKLEVLLKIQVTIEHILKQDIIDLVKVLEEISPNILKTPLLIDMDTMV